MCPRFDAYKRRGRYFGCKVSAGSDWRAQSGTELFSGLPYEQEHWITILLDETADKKKVEKLIDLSFELTEKQFPFVWRSQSAQSAIRQRRMGVGKRMNARRGL